MKRYEHTSRYATILANKLRREIETISSRGQYSGTEGRALHYILANTDRDVFQKDLEEEFGLRSPSASALIRKMEEDGLITRVPVEFDGRYKKIVASDKAMKFKENVMQDMQKLEDKFTAGISEEDKEIWIKVTSRMIENL